jgi:checkpoint serine/threonine-protein kinase
VSVCFACIQTQSNSQFEDSKPHPMREFQQAVNPRTGKLEVVFTDLRQVYPDFDNPMAVEYSFEELRANHRGWSARDWAAIRREEEQTANVLAVPSPMKERPSVEHFPLAPKAVTEVSPKPQTVPLKGSIDDDPAANDENVPPSQAELEKAKAARKARREERANRTRKIKVMQVQEARAETQTSASKHHVYATKLTCSSPSQS